LRGAGKEEWELSFISTKEKKRGRRRGPNWAEKNRGLKKGTRDHRKRDAQKGEMEVAIEGGGQWRERRIALKDFPNAEKWKGDGAGRYFLKDRGSFRGWYPVIFN